MFEVRLRLHERPAGIKPGLFVHARITTRRSPGVLVVPEQALFEQEGATRVFTVKDGTARLVAVVAGEKSDGMVEIRSGLAPGDRVVVSGRELLTDGIAVRVRNGERSS